MIKLILTDMDGTFLNSAHQMPDKTIETIRELQSRGIRFGVASGREYPNLRSYFQEIAKEIIFIADNGTLVYDCDKEIYVDCFEKEEAKRILEKLRHVPNAWVVLCGKDRTYLECKKEEQKRVLDFVHHFYYDIVMVEDAMELVEKQEILEFSVFCEEGAKNVIDKLDWAKEDYQIFVSGEFWIDILNHSAGKGNALKKIQEKYGFKKEECMCFGDYLNDKDMILNAGESYAMENALPEIKAVAKHIAPSNEQGGVISVLRQYFALD